MKLFLKLIIKQIWAGVAKNIRSAQLKREDAKYISTDNNSNAYYVPSPLGFTKGSK